MRKKEKISRLELVEMISDRVGIPKSKVNEVLNSLKDIFRESAMQDKNILVRNFFKVTPYVTTPRKVRIPQTKKVIKTKSKKKIKVHIADAFIREINDKLANKQGKKRRKK